MDGEVVQLYGTVGDHGNGAFRIPFRQTGVELKVLASNGNGWDHVSVSLRHRTPNWYELEYVARLFFKDDEVCMQLHLPLKDHVSIHPNCLHLWRPQGEAIPVPPVEFV